MKYAINVGTNKIVFEDVQDAVKAFDALSKGIPTSWDYIDGNTYDVEAGDIISLASYPGEVLTKPSANVLREHAKREKDERNLAAAVEAVSPEKREARGEMLEAAFGDPAVPHGDFGGQAAAVAIANDGREPRFDQHPNGGLAQ